MCEEVNVFRYDKMRKMHEEGKSYDAIGKYYGVSRQRVHQILSGKSGANSREVMIMKCKFPHIREYFYNNPNMSLNAVCEYAMRNNHFIGQNQLYRVIHNEPISICIEDFKSWEFVFGYPISILFRTDEEIERDIKNR